MADTKITADVLKTYVTIDNKIRLLENQNVRKKHDDMSEHLHRAEDELEILREQFKECERITAKEQKDVTDLQEELKKLAIDPSKGNEQMSKEQAEYEEALATQDAKKKDIEKVQQTIAQIKNDMKSTEESTKQLDALCKEQDLMLGNLFNGQYGSDRENELEADLDLWVEKRQRVGAAQYKWINGRTLLQHSGNQLCFALRRWDELMPINDMERKYQLATEARNNLIAARQNIISAQNYLGDDIKFPYCDQTEMETLDRATNNIYVDMQSKERAVHARNCYDVTCKRESALLQWFDNVINNVINIDLVDAEGTEKELARQLREERVRLLIKKAEEDGTLESEFDDAMKEALKEAAGTDNPPDKGPVISGDMKQDMKQDKVAQKDIKAAPSKEMLFGNMEDLKKRHADHLAAHKKLEEQNKKRQDSGLNQKLEERRLRRARQNNVA